MIRITVPVSSTRLRTMAIAAISSKIYDQCGHREVLIDSVVLVFFLSSSVHCSEGSFLYGKSHSWRCEGE